ncbi:iron transporter, partial [Streptomyces albidoflavus]
MNVTPAPDGGCHSSPRGTSATRDIPADGATVPRQPGGVGTLRFPGGGTDLLEHPDARIAAEAAALESLLRCWVRETSPPAPTHGVLRDPRPARGTALLGRVRHWSLAGWHRF